MRLWLSSVLVLLLLFCTVRIHAQTTSGGTAQVSPVSNTSGNNTKIINDNFQYLQTSVNGILGTFSTYFTNGLLNTSAGGTGANSSSWASGDTVIMTNVGTWGVTPTPVPFSTQNVVTGSRALATVYRNTSGKTMFVTVTAQPNANVVMTAYTDSSSSPSTAVATSKTGTNNYETVTFMVLNNNYYEVTASGQTLQEWVEWY